MMSLFTTVRRVTDCYETPVLQGFPAIRKSCFQGRITTGHNWSELGVGTKLGTKFPAGDLGVRYKTGTKFQFVSTSCSRRSEAPIYLPALKFSVVAPLASRSRTRSPSVSVAICFLMSFITESRFIFPPWFVIESVHDFSSSDQFGRLRPGSMDLSLVRTLDFLGAGLRGNSAHSCWLNASTTFAGAFSAAATPGFAITQLQALQPHAVKVLFSRHTRSRDMGGILNANSAR
jgi:hypothetical protein